MLKPKAAPSLIPAAAAVPVSTPLVEERIPRELLDQLGETHPLAEAFPLWPWSRLLDLAQRFKAGEKQVLPIITVNGKTADGRNRKLALLYAGVTPWTREWDEATDGPLTNFIRNLNLDRRDLTDLQRASAVEVLARAEEQEGRARQQAGLQQSNRLRAASCSIPGCTNPCVVFRPHLTRAGEAPWCAAHDPDAKRAEEAEGVKISPSAPQRKRADRAQHTAAAGKGVKAFHVRMIRQARAHAPELVPLVEGGQLREPGHLRELLALDAPARAAVLAAFDAGAGVPLPQALAAAKAAQAAPLKKKQRRPAPEKENASAAPCSPRVVPGPLPSDQMEGIRSVIANREASPPQGLNDFRSAYETAHEHRVVLLDEVERLNTLLHRAGEGGGPLRPRLLNDIPAAQMERASYVRGQVTGRLQGVLHRALRQEKAKDRPACASEIVRALDAISSALLSEFVK